MLHQVPRNLLRGDTLSSKHLDFKDLDGTNDPDRKLLGHLVNRVHSEHVNVQKTLMQMDRTRSAGNVSDGELSSKQEISNIMKEKTNSEGGVAAELSKNATVKDEFVATLQEVEDWLYEESEDDVLKSIKYNVWSSTPNGNKKFNAAFEDAQRLFAGKPLKCHVFFVPVNDSGEFCGIAEMVGPLNFMKNMDFWQQDTWIGSFPIKWHGIEDVLDTSFQQLIRENNANKHIMYSRDTQHITFTFEDIYF